MCLVLFQVKLPSVLLLCLWIMIHNSKVVCDTGLHLLLPLLSFHDHWSWQHGHSQLQISKVQRINIVVVWVHWLHYKVKFLSNKHKYCMPKAWFNTFITYLLRNYAFIKHIRFSFTLWKCTILPQKSLFQFIYLFIYFWKPSQILHKKRIGGSRRPNTQIFGFYWPHQMPYASFSYLKFSKGELCYLFHQSQPGSQWILMEIEKTRLFQKLSDLSQIWVRSLPTPQRYEGTLTWHISESHFCNFLFLFFGCVAISLHLNHPL